MEEHVRNLSYQIKRHEENIAALEQDKILLKREVDNVSMKKTELSDLLENWQTRTKKLNSTYEEEKERSYIMQSKIDECQEKYNEVKKTLQRVVEETHEKDAQLRKLTEQLSDTEQNLKERENWCQTLKRESRNYEEEYLEMKESKDREIRALKEEIELLRRDLVQMEWKLNETEDKLKSSTLEVASAEKQIGKLKANLDAVYKQNEDLGVRSARLEITFNKATKEKDVVQRNLDRALSRISKLKLAQTNFIKKHQSIIQLLQNDLKENRDYCRVNIFELIKEYESKILELNKFFNSILAKNEENQKAEKDKLRDQLQNEFNYYYEGLKDRNSRVQKDLSEMYEQKSYEKDRAIKNFQETNVRLTEKVSSLRDGIQRIEVKYNNVVEEKEQILKEKEELRYKLEQVRQQYVEEVNKFSNELKTSSQEFKAQKYIIEEEYYNEINILISGIEVLKDKHRENLSKYTKQIEELAQNFKNEINSVENKYKEIKEGLETMLNESRVVEQELAEKVVVLNEKSERLEKLNQELEVQNKALEQNENEYLNGYEDKMQELKDIIEKDNDRMLTFKREKFSEINQQKCVIQTLQKELSLKEEKLKDILNERDLIKSHSHKRLNQGELRESRTFKLKQNTMDENSYDKKGISKTPFLLSDSLSDTYKSPKEIINQKPGWESSKYSENIKQTVQFSDNPYYNTSSTTKNWKQRERSPEATNSNDLQRHTDTRPFRNTHMSVKDFML